jgi:glycosyltransferase-like protein
VADEVHAGWGISPAVIPNGVDSGRFAAAIGDRRGRRAWADQLGDYVLAVGGIEPRKGTLELVEAMARVQRRRPDLRLVIAGGETLFDYRPYRESVFARANGLGVDPVVLGPVEHAALPALVAQASVFAFPSTKEGFGLAAMEALAAGVPVVLRDLPVLREVFGSTVTYVADGSALAAALEGAAGGPDKSRRRAGAWLARSYTWERAAHAHLAFYAELPAAGLSISAT